jgi:RNA polymerase sigma-70 factor (ECF subfamily)
MQQSPQHQEQLYRGCYAPMMKVCSRYANDIDEAGALYNESMLKVLTRLPQYENKGDLMAWIRRIVVNTCIDHCRKQVKFSSLSIDTLQEEIIRVDPEVYKRFSGNDVIRLLQDLPRNTALVFNLFVIEGYKHEEIGQQLGISAGTSKWHLNEGRRLLKSKLDNILKNETYSNAI